MYSFLNHTFAAVSSYYHDFVFINRICILLKLKVFQASLHQTFLKTAFFNYNQMVITLPQFAGSMIRCKIKFHCEIVK